MMNRHIALLLLALLLALPVGARADTALSPSVVLVLKLVSTTHVRPTTGIVVSENGLVAVPADFVSETPAGEIVVLDGGTDILSHGRPADVVRRSTTGGLAILSVEGLRRPGFKLSDNALEDENSLHLSAFPPAEYIAKGAQPLRVPLRASKTGTDSQSVSVSPETPLPYVSGAIIDECGYLAGLSLTRGSQSMETESPPDTMFADELNRELASLQVNLAGASCAAVVQQAKVDTERQDDHRTLANASEPDEESPIDSMDKAVGDTSTDAESETTEPQPPVMGKATMNSPQGATADKAGMQPAKPSLWRSVPVWLPVSVFIVLVMALWKGIVFLRLHRGHKGHAAAKENGAKVQPASDEPDTMLLGESSDTSPPKPRSAPADEAPFPDLNTLPDGCNAVLMLEGFLDTEHPFKRYCPVDMNHFRLVVGRGDVDIDIEHPAISRNHVHIECDAAGMTLSDLGSNNGTYINGVPCLPGETLFFEAGDEIFLGAVPVRISVINQEADVS